MVRVWPFPVTLVVAAVVGCGIETPAPVAYREKPPEPLSLSIPVAEASRAGQTSGTDDKLPTPGPLPTPVGGSFDDLPDLVESARAGKNRPVPFFSFDGTLPGTEDLMASLPPDRPFQVDNSRQIAESLLEQGVNQFQRGEFAAAVKTLNKSIESFQHDPRPYFFIGLAHAQMGQLAEALGDLNIALRLNDEASAIYYHRGNILLRMNDHRKAIGDFSRVLEFEPNHPGAYLGRATAHLNLRNFRQAVRDASRVIDVQPDNTEAWLLRAIGRRYSNDLAGGRLDFEKASELGLPPQAIEHWRPHFVAPDEP